MIFGGIIFLVIGIRFVFGGSDALRSLRGGDIDEAAAKVAMPYMIGPGTVSASIFTGSHLTPPWAILAILIALLLTFFGIILFKIVHDDVKKRDEKLVERYIDIVGRVMSLVIGTFALEMIIQGIEILLTDWGFIA
ncbi:MarC family protein [Spirulina sp. CS-785/01]|uniref:MarC family protein n=1 Tax=Spirulina sp. CS-785/01 TaxID=3021716 RepID=UPI00232AEE5B|nr:MarC family protein [Spirulina sp. CS-785/01]MDB9315660.1 MarC family protein [Spirulina sp. CS-785/01]